MSSTLLPPPFFLVGGLVGTLLTGNAAVCVLHFAFNIFFEHLLVGYVVADDLYSYRVHYPLFTAIGFVCAMLLIYVTQIEPPLRKYRGFETFALGCAVFVWTLLSFLPYGFIGLPWDIIITSACVLVGYAIYILLQRQILQQYTPEELSKMGTDTKLFQDGIIPWSLLLDPNNPNVWNSWRDYLIYFMYSGYVIVPTLALQFIRYSTTIEYPHTIAQYIIGGVLIVIIVVIGFAQSAVRHGVFGSRMQNFMTSKKSKSTSDTRPEYTPVSQYDQIALDGYNSRGEDTGADSDYELHEKDN